MQSDFWLERWELNQIGFHQVTVNSRLEQFWPALEIPADAAVFVPMCGKTLDMHWLREQGHRVFGIELSRSAISDFFGEADMASKKGITITGMEVHSAPGYALYCGDFFDLSAPELPGCLGAYDRGALVAMPREMRIVYADHIQRILPEHSKTLLLTLEYDQSLVSGPPFSVTRAEVERLYGERSSIEVLSSEATQSLPPHFLARGLKEGIETTYVLEKLA